MKKFFAVFILLSSLAVLLMSCSSTKNPSCELTLTSTDSSVSYHVTFSDLNVKQSSYKIEICKGDNVVKNEVVSTTITAGQFHNLELNTKYNVSVYLTSKVEYDTCIATEEVQTKKGVLTGITFHSQSFIYDGKEKSIEVSNLPAGATVEYTGNGIAEVGEHTITAIVKKDNYEDLTLSAKLTITPLILDFEFKDKTVTYTGETQTITATTELELTYEYYSGETKLDSAPRDAGVYLVKAIYLGDKNHEKIEKTATLTITKLSLDFELNNKTVTYTGETQTITATTELELTYEYYLGEAKLDSAPKDAGVYTVKAIYLGDKNHARVEKTATLTIEKAASFITAEDIIIKLGEEYEVSASCSVMGAILNYSYYLGDIPLDAAPTAIGSYTITINFAGNNNYTASEKNISLIITNPENLDVTITLEDITTVYGQDYSVTPVVDHDITLEDVTIKYFKDGIEIEKPVNAGSYEIVVSYPGSEEKYLNPATKRIILTIDKADYDLSAISFSDVVFIYDGTEKKVIISGQLPVGVTVSYTNNTLVEVGQTLATADFIGDFDNYNIIPSMTATLSIEKQTLELYQASKLIYGDAIDISNLLKYFSYEGISAASFEMIKNDIILTLPTDITEIVNAGTYSIHITFSGTDYIYAMDQIVELIIDKATHTIEVIDLENQTITRVAGSEFNYTKDSQTDALYTYSQDLRYAPAGTYKGVVITYPENENYLEASITIQVILTEPTHATDLFISEYYEGKSNDKFLVLFNGTGKTVDLSEYTIGSTTNGEKFTSNISKPISTFDASATTLESGQKLVIYNANLNKDYIAALEAAGCILVKSTTCTFTGNDARLLLHNNRVIDIFGEATGIDPGNGWTFGGLGNATQDHHFVRASYVFHPTALYDKGYKWNPEEWICYGDLTTFEMTKAYQMDIHANKLGNLQLVLDATEYAVNKVPTIQQVVSPIYGYLPALSYYIYDGMTYTKLDTKPDSAGTYYLGYDAQEITIAGQVILIEEQKIQFKLGNNQYINGYLDGSTSEYINIYGDTILEYDGNEHTLLFKQVVGSGFIVTYDGVEYTATLEGEVYQVPEFTFQNAGTYTFVVFAPASEGYLSYNHTYTIIVNPISLPITTEYSTDGESFIEYPTSGLDTGEYEIKLKSPVLFSISCEGLSISNQEATFVDNTYVILLTGVNSKIEITVTSADVNYKDKLVTIAVKTFDPSGVTTVEYDLTKNFNDYKGSWNTSYTQRVLSSSTIGDGLLDATITFDNACKQSNTITDCPVVAAKNNTTYVTLQLNDAGYYIDSFSVNLKQWTTKTFKDIHLEYFNGTEWVTCSDSITVPSVLESFTLSKEVKQVRIAFTTTSTSNVQVGISGFTIQAKAN